jgi:hypothetical protein
MYVGVFENRLLRKMLGTEKDEVTAKWRRLHNVELHYLYSLRNNSRVINSRRIRKCNTHWRQKKTAHRGLVGEYEGKIPLGRSRRRWEDNFKVDLQEVEWRHGRDWFGSGYGKVGFL